MSLKEFADYLRGQIPDEAEYGAICLDKTSLSKSGVDAVNIQNILDDIHDYLHNYLNLPEEVVREIKDDDKDRELVISQLTRADIPDLKEDDTELSIKKGRTSFLNADMDVQELKFILEGDQLSLILQTNNLKGLDGKKWMLHTNFPTLYEFSVLENHLTNPIYVFSTVEKKEWPIFQDEKGVVRVDLKEGLNFYADLSIEADHFLYARQFLTYLNKPVHSKFHIFGQIDLRETQKGEFLEYPTVKLVTPVISKEEGSFTLFNFLEVCSPKFGFRTQLVEVDDAEEDPDQEFESDDDEEKDLYQKVRIDSEKKGDPPKNIVTELYFELEIILNNKITLDFSATLLKNSGFLMFGVRSPKSLGVSDVVELMAGNKWDDVVPELLKSVLDQIVFHGFLMTVFIKQQKKDSKDGSSDKDSNNNEDNGKISCNLSSIAVSVGSNPDKQIKLFPPFGDFSYEMVWTILNPTKTEEEGKLSTAGFTAKVNFEGVGELDVEIAGQL